MKKLTQQTKPISFGDIAELLVTDPSQHDHAKGVEDSNHRNQICALLFRVAELRQKLCDVEVGYNVPKKTARLVPWAKLWYQVYGISGSNSRPQY